MTYSRTCRAALLASGLVLLMVAPAIANEGRPNLNGTWKLDQAKSDSTEAAKDLMLLIDETGDNIHMKETRGPHSKSDVSDFTCDTFGKECEMQDGGDKAHVTVYYNGPVLVVLKTNGRRGSSVEKRRLSLSAAGDALNVEVIHIDPQAKTEKLVFSKAQ